MLTCSDSTEKLEEVASKDMTLRERPSVSIIANEPNSIFDTTSRLELEGKNAMLHTRKGNLR